MTISEVYKKYQIMPNLRLHQFRVAGVAQLICEHLLSPINTHDVIAACLLHDMGNIIKFDLGRFPEALEPEGLEYWQGVQNDFFAKYGWDEHLATKKIAEELGVSARVYELIDAVGFAKTEENFASKDTERKICPYADMRVAPYGVVSLQERCDDLEKRYSTKYPSEPDKSRRNQFRQFAEKIEAQVFALTDFQPGDVTDAAVNDKIEALKSFQF